MRIVVVLPAPLSPRKPKTSPRFTSNDTSRTASIDPYDFDRLRIEMAGTLSGMARTLRP